MTKSSRVMFENGVIQCSMINIKIINPLNDICMEHSITFSLLHQIFTATRCSIISNEGNRFRKVMKIAHDGRKWQTTIPLIDHLTPLCEKSQWLPTALKIRPKLLVLPLCHLRPHSDWPPASLSLSLSCFLTSSSHSGNVGLLSVPPTRQALFILWLFALAIPFSWNTDTKSFQLLK